MAELLCKINNHKLMKENDFYFVLYPFDQTMVNTSGTKEELITELTRWKNGVDSNNDFMLEVENLFIKKLLETNKEKKLIGEATHWRERTKFYYNGIGEQITIKNSNGLKGIAARPRNFQEAVDCIIEYWGNDDLVLA